MLDQSKICKGKKNGNAFCSKMFYFRFCIFYQTPVKHMYEFVMHYKKKYFYKITIFF